MRKEPHKYHMNNKIKGTTTYILITILNANGLNSPFRRHRLED
jgi:hypothetical protein